MISAALKNQEARRVTKVTLSASIPMMLTPILISDSGHHPDPIWGMLETAGVVLLAVSLPFQTYEWYARVSLWFKRAQNGSD